MGRIKTLKCGEGPTVVLPGYLYSAIRAASCRDNAHRYSSACRDIEHSTTQPSLTSRWQDQHQYKERLWVYWSTLLNLSLANCTSSTLHCPQIGRQRILREDGRFREVSGKTSAKKFEFELIIIFRTIQTFQFELLLHFSLSLFVFPEYFLHFYFCFLWYCIEINKEK